MCAQNCNRRAIGRRCSLTHTAGPARIICVVWAEHESRQRHIGILASHNITSDRLSERELQQSWYYDILYIAAHLSMCSPQPNPNPITHPE